MNHLFTKSFTNCRLFTIDDIDAQLQSGEARSLTSDANTL